MRARSLLVLGLAVLAGCERHDQLKMVAPRLEIDKQVAADFARLFDDPNGIEIELVPNSDPERPGLHMLKSGAADLALVPNTEAYDPELTTIVSLYPTVLHIAYRADEPVDDVLSFIVDRTVFAGPPGSPSRQLLETTARKDGIEPDRINYATDQTGCADVIVVYAPVLPEIPGAISACGKYRLFSLGRPEEIGSGSALDSVALLNPSLEPFVIPRETYGALTPEPVATLAVDKLLVARSELPEAVIYDLLREILRLKPALSASRPGLFHQLGEGFDNANSTFALHPGALAYLQRDEPDIYERYSGIAEVLVTLLIGLVSGIYGVFRIITIRRKNRIDAFCREAIDIRDRARSAPDKATRLQAGATIRDLQDRAYDMLIHEKLAADESFRIFITLCSDILADLSDQG